MSVVQWLQRAGEYQLAEQLGFNGVVATYKGFQPDTKQFVAAVALDKAEMGESPAFPRFVNEFTALQNAPASRLVRGIAYGEETRFYWAAYEWMMRGRHLGHIVQESGLPPAGQAYELMSQVIEGLITLHQFGFPHRIITPATIFINDLQQVKILYTGWSTLILGVKDGAAHPNFMSNLPFLAPEVAAGREGDFASDVYSVGANLYFLLTGQPTHWTDDPRQLSRLIASTPVNLSPLRQIVTGPAAEIVEEMLDLDPANRPMNMEALRDRLASFASAFAEPEQDDSQRERVLDIRDPEAEVNSPQSAMMSEPPSEEEIYRAPMNVYLDPTELEAEPPPPPPPPLAPDLEKASPPTANWDAPVPELPTPSPAVMRPTPQRQPQVYRPQSRTKVSPVVITWLLVGVFLLIGGLAWVSWRFFLGPIAQEKPAETPVDVAQNKEKKEKPAGPDELKVTRERLLQLGTLNRDYFRTNGAWPLAIGDLAPSEESAADAWGTAFDVREAFIVSAGADKKWDSADDMWFDSEAMELGGKV